MNNFLDKDIIYLNLDKKISNVLKQNNINKINDLWSHNRKNLKDIGMTDSDIKEITIKLELNGLELNRRLNKERN